LQFRGVFIEKEFEGRITPVFEGEISNEIGKNSLLQGSTKRPEPQTVSRKNHKIRTLRGASSHACMFSSGEGRGGGTSPK